MDIPLSSSSKNMARGIRRVPLVVAANEIIIGEFSHSSSTAAWQSGWLCGAVAAER